MYRATRDLLLPTTIIGSLPRPHWYTAQLEDHPFRLAMDNARFREQYTDAVSALLRDQEQAGLDVVTDGDSRFDDDVAGGSWMMYPARHLAGTAGLALDSSAPSRFARGTIMYESSETRPAPVVVGKIGRGTLEFTPLWKTAQRLTARPVKFGTPAAEVVESYLVNRYYADRLALAMDVADAMNAELADLARAGCPAIQIEASWITRAAHGQRPDMWAPAVYADIFERTTRGLGEHTEVWCHTCWGNPAAQRPFAFAPSYAPTLDHLNALPCDVITFENADNGGQELELICREVVGKKIALGTVSHRSLQVERPDEVAAIVRRALQWVPPERLIVTADCGFGREGMSRRIAFYKMVSLVQGTNLVRRELGLAERPCPAADPAYGLS